MTDPPPLVDEVAVILSYAEDARLSSDPDLDLEPRSFDSGFVSGATWLAGRMSEASSDDGLTELEKQRLEEIICALTRIYRHHYD